MKLKPIREPCDYEKRVEIMGRTLTLCKNKNAEAYNCWCADRQLCDDYWVVREQWRNPL